MYMELRKEKALRGYSMEGCQLSVEMNATYPVSAGRTVVTDLHTTAGICDKEQKMGT
jgi:hypothetical protein